MRFMLVLLVLLFSDAARAGPGVLEINQACATQTGCFSGDSAGFPVTIGASGSYRLTGALTVPNGTTTAILMTSSFVTLDLGGFEIRGPVECFGEPAFCPAAQSGVGMNAANVGQVTVRNGIVRGMGGAGLALGEVARVEGVTAISNGAVGIGVGRLSQVRNSTAQSNGGDGIGGDSANNTIVDSCTSFGNVGSGIRLDDGSSVFDSTIFANGLQGIHFPLNQGFIRGNTIRANQGVTVNGARSLGGNYCDDARCSVRGIRRFYLTTQFFTGANANSACLAGFHMASFWELHFSPLEYAPSPIGRSNPGSGTGPPNDPGWIKPGVDNNGITCSGWTSNSGTGKLAALVEPVSSGSATAVAPWVAISGACSGASSVWCIED